MELQVQNINELVILDNYTERIKRAAETAFNSYIEIGVLLWELDKNKKYEESGYKTLLEYAEGELKFKKSSVYNFMKVAERFSVKEDGKPTSLLTEEYKDYSYSQLVELTKIKNEDDIEKIDPSMSVREIKKAAKESNDKLKKNVEDREPEIEGQISVLDIVEESKEQNEIIKVAENDEEKKVEISEKLIEESQEEQKKEPEIIEVQFTEKEEVEEAIFQTSGIEMNEEISQEEKREKIELFTEKEINIMIDSIMRESRLRYLKFKDETELTREKEECYELVEKIKDNFIPKKQDIEVDKNTDKKDADNKTVTIEPENQEEKSKVKIFKKEDIELPEELEKVYKKYREDDTVSRMIYYPNNSLKVEFESEKYVYFGIDGEEGTTIKGKAAVIPKEEIIYYNEQYYKRDPTEKQNRSIKILKDKAPRYLKSLKQMVHRNGDYNVLLIRDEGIWSMNEHGKETFQTSGNIDEIEKIELGTKIITEYAGEEIDAEVKKIYGFNNETLNISRDGK